MHEIFENKGYSSGGRPAIERDAQLAMDLVLYLSDSQESREGCWHEQHLTATLRRTCHVLEALYLLDGHAFEHVIDLGISWLVNLSDNLDDNGDDAHSLRLQPSRFKTLAWLNALDDPQVLDEFERLRDQIADADILNESMTRPLLPMMALVDCFFHLDRQGKLAACQLGQAQKLLDCVERHLSAWQREPSSEVGSSLSTAGDASYALDLLIRWQRWRATDTESARVVSLLQAEIERLERQQGISVNLLYCVIQLAGHFGSDRHISQSLHRILQKIRTLYDSHSLDKQPEVVHPLILRSLLAVHGESLRAKMMGHLLQGQLTLLQERNQTNDLELRRAFQEVIKRRLDVEIRKVEPLSGGITNDEVYRVDYVINLTSPYQLGDLARTQFPGPESLVIKQGSRASLNRTVQRYQALPTSVKDFFARHADDPQLLAIDPITPAYLILEDLTDQYDTFRNMLNQADQRRLTRPQSQALRTACNTIMQGLAQIYDSTKREHNSFVSHQLSRLYLSPIERHANRITESEKHPHLREWAKGFWMGKRHFPSLEHYLNIIERNRTKIGVVCLMLVHGDCHARNIMLGNNYERLKLIDLDKLDYRGDYIWDIAELIEDVAVFRFLFDPEFRFSHDRSLVHFPSSDPLNPEAIETRIDYAPFTSRLTQEFQHHILALLEDYATKIKDASWKPRLWLALATHLLYLVSKHDEREHASVLYVEAMKLLDDLCAFLHRDVPLPTIPFPETHSDPSRRANLEPFTQRDQKPLRVLHQAIVAMSDDISYEVQTSGNYVRYYRREIKWPVVVLDGVKRPSRALLAMTVDELLDPNGLAKPIKGSGALGTVVIVDEEGDPGSVTGLVEQVVRVRILNE